MIKVYIYIYIYIIKGIFIIPTEDIHKKQHLVLKRADTTKASANFEKIFLNINSRYILGKLTIFHEIWMSC